jgi:hypothetical protein
LNKLPDRCALDRMLVDHRIHVYLSLTDEVDRPEAQAACTAILSSAERERAQRLQSERQRREFILAHGLVRAVLSRRVPAIHPADWRFRIDRHGRPSSAGLAARDSSTSVCRIPTVASHALSRPARR